MGVMGLNAAVCSQLKSILGFIQRLSGAIGERCVYVKAMRSRAHRYSVLCMNTIDPLNSPAVSNACMAPTKSGLHLNAPVFRLRCVQCKKKVPQVTLRVYSECRTEYHF